MFETIRKISDPKAFIFDNRYKIVTIRRKIEVSIDETILAYVNFVFEIPYLYEICIIEPKYVIIFNSSLNIII